MGQRQEDVDANHAPCPLEFRPSHSFVSAPPPSPELPFPPQDLDAFLALCAGEWLALRSLFNPAAGFASIGAVSTVLFAVLFALLRGPLGPLGADVVALGVCSVANTAANRRLTFSLRGRTNRARHHAGLGQVDALFAVIEQLDMLGLVADLAVFQEFRAHQGAA
jgi:putative flippase GtrA